MEPAVVRDDDLLALLSHCVVPAADDPERTVRQCRARVLDRGRRSAGTDQLLPAPPPVVGGGQRRGERRTRDRAPRQDPAGAVTYPNQLRLRANHRGLTRGAGPGPTLV